MSDHGHINRVPPRVILFGGTGQAKVLRPILEHHGGKVVAVFDDTPDYNLRSQTSRSTQATMPSRGGWRRRCAPRSAFALRSAIPTAGSAYRLHDRFVEDGLSPVTLVHQAAFIDHDVEIGAGSQIMAGAIVCTESRIGRQCIINTRASVDHEGLLEDGCEVAPGATLCGIVHMKENAWVCAGATVLPRITIGVDAIVGAGALVNRDVPDGVTVVGVPARVRG